MAGSFFLDSVAFELGGDREMIEVLANRSNRQAVCGSGA